MMRLMPCLASHKLRGQRSSNGLSLVLRSGLVLDHIGALAKRRFEELRQQTDRNTLHVR